MKRILIILLTCLSLNAWADKWYIATTGSDTHGKGTLADPWLTLKHACDTVTGANFIGDTIVVGVGTFTETAQSALGPGVSIYGAGVSSIITSSAALNPIVLLSSGSEGTNGNQSISYVKFDGNLTAISAIDVVARSNVEIHHCSFTETVKRAISFGGRVSGDGAPTIYATNNRIYSNTFTNCANDEFVDPYYYASASIWFGGQAGMLIYNNNIDEAYGRHGYGIKGLTNNGYNHGVKIYDNTIKIDVGRGVSNSWAMAIELWSQRGGIEIYGNTIINGAVDIGGYDTDDSFSYGFAVRIYDNVIEHESLIGFEETAILLELDVSGGVYIFNNYIHNFPIGLSMYQHDGDSLSDLYVYYNIFNEMRQSGSGYTGRITEISTLGTTSYTNLNFFNNTIYNSTQTIGSAFWFNVSNATVTYIRVINNIIVNAYNHMRFENHNPDYVWNTNNNVYGCNQNTITYYNSTPGTHVIEANNSLITDNPKFKSTSTFRLDPSSPCIDAGVDVGLTRDFKGHKVPQNGLPDIGALENGKYLMILNELQL